MVPIDVSITVYEALHIDVGDAPYDGPSYTAEIDSSTYFVVADETVGPTSGIWWGDSEPTLLSIPVIDTDSMELNTLYVNAWKRTCALGWSTWWNLNSAQVADSSCDQWVHLDAATNSHLIPGHTYRSPYSQPVLISAMQWHGGGGELDRTAYHFEYTAP